MSKPNLFVVPSAYIFQYQVKNHQEIKEALLPTILKKYTKNKPNPYYRWSPTSQSNITTNYSYQDLNLLSQKQQRDIIWDALDEMFSIFYSPTSFVELAPFPPKESKLVGCWWNVYDEGDYVELHGHNLTGISGVYILDLPDDQENGTIFTCSNPFPLSHQHAEMSQLRYYTSHVKEGSVLLFPSALTHYVNPVAGRKVSISFNIDVTCDLDMLDS